MSMFNGFLPFKVITFPFTFDVNSKFVLKIFIAYINEGIKIYFRMCYSLAFMLRVLIIL